MREGDCSDMAPAGREYGSRKKYALGSSSRKSLKKRTSLCQTGAWPSAASTLTLNSFPASYKIQLQNGANIVRDLKLKPLTACFLMLLHCTIYNEYLLNEILSSSSNTFHAKTLLLLCHRKVVWDAIQSMSNTRQIGVYSLAQQVMVIAKTSWTSKVFLQISRLMLLQFAHTRLSAAKTTIVIIGSLETP